MCTVLNRPGGSSGKSILGASTRVKCLAVLADKAYLALEPASRGSRVLAVLVGKVYFGLELESVV